MQRTETKLPGSDLLDEEPPEEELWLVSYADMMTLLFGFFVILFSFSNIDEKKFQDITANMAKSFQAKVVAAEPQGTSTPRLLKSAPSRDREVAKDTAPKPVVKPPMQEIILSDVSLFEPGSASIRPESERNLQRLARDLLSRKGLKEVEIVGHTDSSPPAPESFYADHFTLSSLRAGAVAQILVKSGLNPRLLSVRGMGNLKPLAPDRDRRGRPIPANMAKNRRVHIVVRWEMEGRFGR